MKTCRDQDLIDRYLMGKLGEAENTRFEEHYFDCRACFEMTRERGAVLDVIKQRGDMIFAPATRPEAKASPWEKVAAFFAPRQWAAAALAAAVLLVVGLGVLPQFKSSAPEFVFTGDETVRGETLELLNPPGNVTLPPETLGWKAVGGAAEYSVVLTQEAETLWTATTAETKIAFPKNIREKLAAGRSYRWQVKAYSAEGTLIAASPKSQFTIIP
jgi:hypothetical protein